MYAPTVFLSFALVAFAASGALAAMPVADEWNIGPWVRGRNYSPGMPAHPAPGPGGSVQFRFPVAGEGQIDAMTTTVLPLSGASQVTLRYRIDIAPGTRFIADEARDEPATVSLYLQRRGDNWSARGAYASYRWYVPPRGVIPLSPGEHNVTIRFDEAWTNVHGQSNRDDPAGYATALRETSRIGIAFGSAALRSHGVFATGAATFTLLHLGIR
ncbi:hypothetical protein [Croceibacterium aestuarii]|uniref:hypothetical protein n=1 Tax=Croceibacterium aestuarii TaxID=3064139 RepID=UPI00272DCAAC|nr:hypothetical protein [Croceibacterium sp. D39]